MNTATDSSLLRRFTYARRLTQGRGSCITCALSGGGSPEGGSSSTGALRCRSVSPSQSKPAAPRRSTFWIVIQDVVQIRPLLAVRLSGPPRSAAALTYFAQSSCVEEPGSAFIVAIILLIQRGVFSRRTGHGILWLYRTSSFSSRKGGEAGKQEHCFV